jgi:mannose-6-phosphate isomerase
VTTSGREDSHLGLGFERAMGAVSHQALGTEQLAALRDHCALDATGPVPQRCLPVAADPFFRLDVLAPAGGTTEAVPSGFAAVVALDGQGSLVSDAGETPVARGEILAVPAGFGDWSARGQVHLAVSRPGLGWPERSGS